MRQVAEADEDEVGGNEAKLTHGHMRDMSKHRAKWLEASPRNDHRRQLGRDNQEDEAEDLWESMVQIQHPHPGGGMQAGPTQDTADGL